MIENLKHRGSPAERLAELEALGWDLVERVQAGTGDSKDHEREAKTLLAALSRLQSMIALDLRMAEKKRKEVRPQSPLQSEEWQHTKLRLLEALQPFPEAMAAVVEALDDSH